MKAIFVLLGDGLVSDVCSQRDQWSTKILAKTTLIRSVAAHKKIHDVARKAITHHGFAPPMLAES